MVSRGLSQTHRVGVCAPISPPHLSPEEKKLLSLSDATRVRVLPTSTNPPNPGIIISPISADLPGASADPTGLSPQCCLHCRIQAQAAGARVAHSFHLIVLQARSANIPFLSPKLARRALRPRKQCARRHRAFIKNTAPKSHVAGTHRVGVSGPPASLGTMPSSNSRVLQPGSSPNPVAYGFHGGSILQARLTESSAG